MRNRIFLVFFAAAALAGACAQDDSPSLGDVARQTRLQKQKDAKPADAKDAATKNTSSKDSQTVDAESPKSKHVITNDEIPSRSGPTGYRPTAQTWNQNYRQPAYSQPNSDAQKIPPQYWSQQMQAAKSNITSLQSAIDRANSAQHGNCIADCVQSNLEQQRQQQQVEQMKSQLEGMQHNLEQAQDQCRQQGYGGSVCDP